MNKKIFYILAVISLCLFTELAVADTVTILYINGIDTSFEDALKNKQELENKYLSKLKAKYPNKTISFRFAYNQSEGRVLDLLESYHQHSSQPNTFWTDLAGGTIWNLVPYSDFISYYTYATERDTFYKILQHVNNLLSMGDKVIMVAHSQGNFYANELYENITKQNINAKENLDMISIASPANYRAHGFWLTLSCDSILTVPGAESNYTLDLPLGSHGDPENHHNFKNEYLGNEEVSSIIYDMIDATIFYLYNPTVINDIYSPRFTPAAGIYSNAQSVTLSTIMLDADIRYTTDGTNPTSTTGTKFSGPIPVSSSVTIRAIAYDSNGSTSAVSSATYTIQPSPSVSTIGAGMWHSLGIKNTGEVWAWGYNIAGQLGDGSTTYRKTPVQVKGVGGSEYLNNIQQITGGNEFTLGLKIDGTVYGWGSNAGGRLGDGTTSDSVYPVQVIGQNGVGFINNITIVAAGGNHSVALRNDGTVWSWGINIYGQLGDGTISERHYPVQVKDQGGTNYLTGIISVTSRQNSSYALKNDGTVWAWGRNSNGQLGNGTASSSSLPVQVKGVGGVGYLTGVIAIASGRYDGHVLALKNDGTVWAWGLNSDGQLGDGTISSKLTPVQVKGSGGTGFLSGITAISAGALHSVALKNDGTVWTWGGNSYGQLGIGNQTQSLYPVKVKNTTGGSFLTEINAIETGYDHCVAIDTDGTIFVWGRNNYGQIGDGTINSKSLPVQLTW